MIKKSEGKGDDNKRVYGKFNLQFDLQKILSNIKKLASLQGKERASEIRSKSFSQTGMLGIEHTATTGNIEGTGNNDGSTINFSDPKTTTLNSSLKRTQTLPF